MVSKVGSAATGPLLALPAGRFPTGPLLLRSYELRANVTVYDACYIALAEGLDCPLVTADGRLSRSPGVRCEVELLSV